MTPTPLVLRLSGYWTRNRRITSHQLSTLRQSGQVVPVGLVRHVVRDQIVGEYAYSELDPVLSLLLPRGCGRCHRCGKRIKLVDLLRSEKRRPLVDPEDRTLIREYCKRCQAYRKYWSHGGTDESERDCPPRETLDLLASRRWAVWELVDALGQD